MNMTLAILEIYPTLNPLQDFIIGYDYESAGYVIREWYVEDVTEPTLEELNSAWLSYLKREKINNLNTDCDSTIVKGFVSPSTQFEFEFESHDQNNLSQQAIVLMNDITIPSISWKTKNQGIQTLTREQFFGIIKESEAHKRYNIGKYWQLKAQVESATTEEAINEINW
jgi:hypothetical protein